MSVTGILKIRNFRIVSGDNLRPFVLVAVSRCNSGYSTTVRWSVAFGGVDACAPDDDNLCSSQILYNTDDPGLDASQTTVRVLYL